MAREKTASSRASAVQWMSDLLVEGSPAPIWLALATATAAFIPIFVTVFFAPHMAAASFLGAIAMITGVRGSGYRVASLAMLVGGCAVVLVLFFAAWAPLIAALLALMASLFGYFGHARPMIVVCLTWSVFTGNIIPEDNPGMALALYWGGALFALGVAWLSNAAHSFPAEDSRSRAHALVLGIIFAIGFAFSTWFGRAYFGELGSHGYFFPLAFAFLCLPPHSRFFGNTIKRCLGTALGWLLSIGILALSLPAWASIILGITSYVMFQWLISWSKLISMIFLTTAIIIIIGIVSPNQPIATQRLDAVLAAAAMASALALVAIAVLRVVSPKALKELAGSGPKA